jgi:hypothetical protein
MDKKQSTYILKHPEKLIFVDEVDRISRRNVMAMMVARSLWLQPT